MPGSSIRSESLMRSSRFIFSLSAKFIAAWAAVPWAGACTVLCWFLSGSLIFPGRLNAMWWVNLWVLDTLSAVEVEDNGHYFSVPFPLVAQCAVMCWVSGWTCSHWSPSCGRTADEDVVSSAVFSSPSLRSTMATYGFVRLTPQSIWKNFWACVYKQSHTFLRAVRETSG